MLIGQKTRFRLLPAVLPPQLKRQASAPALPAIRWDKPMPREFHERIAIEDRAHHFQRVSPLLGKAIQLKRDRTGLVSFFSASLDIPGTILYGPYGRNLLNDVKKEPDKVVDVGKGCSYPLEISLYLNAILLHEAIHLIQIGMTSALLGIFRDQDLVSRQIRARQERVKGLSKTVQLAEDLYRHFVFEYHASRISGAPTVSLAYAIGASIHGKLEALVEEHAEEAREVQIDQIKNVQQLRAWSLWWRNLQTSQLRQF